MPWTDNCHYTPKKEHDKFRYDKLSVQNYIDKIWVAKGSNAWVQFFVSHQLEEEGTFKKKNNLSIWCQENGYLFFIEKIQDKAQTKIGWFLGIHLEMQPKNIHKALMETGEFRDDSIDTRMEFITMGKGGPKSKTRAINVYASFNYASKARAILLKIYSTKNESFPMGIQARLIPIVQDTRFVNTLQSRTSAKRAVNKHDHFHKLMMTVPNYDIISLDSEINGVSLR